MKTIRHILILAVVGLTILVVSGCSRHKETIEIEETRETVVKDEMVVEGDQTTVKEIK